MKKRLTTTLAVAMALSLCALPATAHRISFSPAHVPSSGVLAQQLCDWPTVHHDVARTGHSSCAIDPPLTEMWTRAWQGEMMATRAEAIVANGSVFVGTYAGKMHALDARDGTERWAFTTEGRAAIAHSPAVGDDRVIFGDVGGRIYGLDAETGAKLWEFSGHGPGGFLTSPAIYNDVAYLGSQDGYMYAVALANGTPQWEHHIGTAVLNTAAVSGGVVFFGAEDMHIYALDADTGDRVWKSQKLYGVSLRDYYPVVAGDALIIRTIPPTDFKREDLQPSGEFLESLDLTAEEEQDAIRDRLDSNPHLRTFYVLDISTGMEKFRAPVLYGPAGNAGSPPPPVVMGDGTVVTYYRADESVWELNPAPRHANFAVGIMDMTSGGIQQIRHNQGASNDPWSTAWWCIGDESAVLSGGGNRVYNTHQGGLSSVDIASGAIFPLLNVRDTWGGHPRPVWAANEWHGVARGSIAIADGSLYWIVGSRVIALRGS